MKSIIALTVAAFTLASCGGGSNPATSATRDIGVLPPGFAATIDGDEVVLTINGVEEARLVTVGPFSAGFTIYAEGDEVALYAQTISGAGAVFVVQSPTANLELAGVQFARLGDTDLPGGGSATFNGNYAGVLVDTDLVGVDGIEGAAQLTADFASATISGDITNREANSGFPDDIQLLSTSITSAGAFSGTTTGGDIPFLSTALDGAYVGLIVGATGNEVVGGVSVTHLVGGDLFLEIGGFVATQ